MQIINCVQGTEEWYKARLGVATASEFSKVITSDGKPSTQLRDYAHQLASELLTVEQDDFYTNIFMERGTELEQEARSKYEEFMLSPVQEVGFVCCGHYGCSPDGLVGKKGQIQFKCPTQKIHAKYLYDNKLPTTYKAQVQGELLCTEREWSDFVSFHPNFIDDKKLFIVRVYRDEGFIKSLKSGLDKLNDLKQEILSKIRGNNA